MGATMRMTGAGMHVPRCAMEDLETTVDQLGIVNQQDYVQMINEGEGLAHILHKATTSLVIPSGKKIKDTKTLS